MGEEEIRHLDDEPPSAILERAVPPGTRITVADEHGRCAELRVKVLGRDSIVASAVSDRVVAGERVTARSFDGSAVRLLTFVVDEIEDTRDGRVDVLARLVFASRPFDERLHERLAFDGHGYATVADDGAAPLDPRRSPVRIAHVSGGGVAFYADRRFESGEAVDLAFADEGGGLVRCRVAVLRVERAVYGRRHYAARILAIGETDQVRLDRVCSRARLRAAAAAAAAAAEEPPLRDVLLAGATSVGLLRRFRRA